MSFQLAELQEEKITTQEEKITTQEEKITTQEEKITTQEEKITTQEEKITTQEAENIELKRQIKCKDKVNLCLSVGMNPAILILGRTPG